MEASLDPKAYRHALGRYATGVAIVTAEVDGQEPLGITINSFTSVSLSPPLVLWCLDESSTTAPGFAACDGFVINVLAHDQHALALDLAKRGHHSLRGVALDAPLAGMPVIKGALAHLVCRVHDRQPVGDHVVYIGHVDHVRIDEAGAPDPLIFFAGRFDGLGKASPRPIASGCAGATAVAANQITR